MSAASVRVALQAPSEARNVAVVRAVLSGVAQVTGIDVGLLADLQTAVSEACNNVVLRAYGDEPGPMRVQIDVRASGVELRVRDRGRGFSASDGESHGGGLGVAVINALADRVEFVAPDDGGTEVRIWFARAVNVPGLAAAADWPRTTLTFAAGQLQLWISPTSVCHAVLPKLAVLLAATERFSIPLVGRAREAAALVARYAELVDADTFEATVAANPRWLGAAIRNADAGTDAAQSAAEDARRAARVAILDELANTVTVLGCGPEPGDPVPRLRLELRRPG